MSVVLPSRLNFIKEIQHHSQHIAHTFEYLLDIVNQILDKINAFFGMLHNLNLVKVYVHGVTISKKQ